MTRKRTTRKAANKTTPASGAAKIVSQVNALNKWRERYNPLRGLTIAKAVSLLEAGQRGEFADVSWAYYFIEQTDPDLFALVERRTSAVLDMDYDFKVVSEAKRKKDFDEKLAEDQAVALREGYERIDNIYEAWEHLAMGSFRSFAHVQMHQDSNGDIVHLEPLDQWNWVRDGMYGPWYWNPEARSVTHKSLQGNKINEASFIIRVVRRHVDRIGLVKFIRMNLSQKDYDAFVEIYGVPGRVIIGPPDVPEDKENDYRDAAENIAEGASGYLPHGSTVESDNQIRGVAPFEKHMRFLQEQLVLAGTGGMLTMLTQSGSGTLAGGAHQETFEIIARSEARKISELFQRKLDAYILERAFPDKPHLAYFQIASQDERDVGDIVDHAAKLKSAGYEIDQQHLEERTGYKLQPVQAEPETPPPPAPNRSVRAANRKAPEAEEVSRALSRRATDQLARTQAQLLEPERAKLEMIAEMTDPEEQREALRRMRDSLPERLREMNADPETARVLENTLAAGLINGWSRGTVEREPAEAAA